MMFGFFDQDDMAFMENLTGEQQEALQRLITHVIQGFRAAEKGLTPEQLRHPEGKCRHCGLPVAKRGDGSWTHVGPDGQTDRGCRAALFHVDEEAWFASEARTYAAPMR